MGKHSVVRKPSPPPDHNYLWRTLDADELAILNKSPVDYGLEVSQLKELHKATKLRNQKCVQMSKSEMEARSWLSSGGALIRVERAKLGPTDFEEVSGHHFVFVTGKAVVQHHEIIT